MTMPESEANEVFSGLFTVTPLRDAAPIQNLADAMGRAAASIDSQNLKKFMPAGGYMYELKIDDKPILSLAVVSSFNCTSVNISKLDQVAAYAAEKLKAHSEEAGKIIKEQKDIITSQALSEGERAVLEKRYGAKLAGALTKERTSLSYAEIAPTAQTIVQACTTPTQRVWVEPTR